MTDFLLVHGAWHGGWCWKRVAAALSAAGHRVFTPSLTGLGDRRHLLGPQTGLSSHVADILAVIESEELSDIVLCGHSYGGAVALLAADRAPWRVGALVLLDALFPEPGRSLLDLDGEERRNLILSRAVETEHGAVLPPAPAAMYALASPEDAAWVDRRCAPHPLRTFQDVAELTGAWQEVPHLAYAATLRFRPPDFRAIAARLAEGGRFAVSTLDTGHEAMIDGPAETAALLMDAGRAAAGGTGEAAASSA